jgi:hypothetical protein
VNLATIALPRAPALRLLASLAAFQAAWFACVLLAARGDPMAAVASVLAAMVLHFAWSDRRRADAWLTVVALAIGVAWDSAMARSGIVHYAAPWPAIVAAPVWILALWALFATTLRQPLRWLHGRPVLAALFGGIGGPLSYAAAARLGACTLPDASLAMVVLGIGWAIATPLLLQLARRLEREVRA